MQEMPERSSDLIDILKREFPQMTPEDQFLMLRDSPNELAYEMGKQYVVDFLKVWQMKTAGLLD